MEPWIRISRAERMGGTLGQLGRYAEIIDYDQRTGIPYLQIQQSDSNDQTD